MFNVYLLFVPYDIDTALWISVINHEWLTLLYQCFDGCWFTLLVHTNYIFSRIHRILFLFFYKINYSMLSHLGIYYRYLFILQLCQHICFPNVSGHFIRRDSGKYIIFTYFKYRKLGCRNSLGWHKWSLGTFSHF